MQETQLYKLLKQIKNDKFDIDELHHYNLSLILGPRDLQLAIIDHRTHQCMMMEDYVLSAHDRITDKIQIITEIFESHHLLMAGFWHSVKLVIKNKQYSLVPCSLFDQEITSDYVEQLCPPLNESAFGFHNKVTDTETVFAFLVEKKLIHWFKSHYPNLEIEIFHQGTLLLCALLDQYPSGTFFMIDRFVLHVVILKDKKLQYYNQFSIKNFDDYARYSAIALHEFGISNKEPIGLLGFLKEESAHYKELKKYFSSMFPVERSAKIQFSYHFDELESHQYYDLFATYLCN